MKMLHCTDYVGRGVKHKAHSPHRTKSYAHGHHTWQGWKHQQHRVGNLLNSAETLFPRNHSLTQPQMTAERENVFNNTVSQQTPRPCQESCQRFGRIVRRKSTVTSNGTVGPCGTSRLGKPPGTTIGVCLGGSQTCRKRKTQNAWSWPGSGLTSNRRKTSPPSLRMRMKSFKIEFDMESTTARLRTNNHALEDDDNSFQHGRIFSARSKAPTLAIGQGIAVPPDARDMTHCGRKTCVLTMCVWIWSQHCYYVRWSHYKPCWIIPQMNE